MEDAKINQKEYLKKYLSKKDDGKKKKKKKIKVGQKTVHIIDDDIDLKKLVPIDDEEISIFNTTEDAPQIVGVIDERGPINFDDKQRWKLIADDGTGDIQIKKIEQLKRNIIDHNDFNNSEIKKHSLLKDSKSEKNKLKHKSSKKKKKHHSPSSSSSNSSENESDSSDNRKSKKKKSKHSSKKRKKMKKDDSSIIDSSSDSDIDNNSDSDTSVPRKSKKKKKKKSSKKKSKTNDSDLGVLGSSKHKNVKVMDSDMNHQRENETESFPRSNRDAQQDSNKRMRSSDSDLSPLRANKKSEILDRRKRDSSMHANDFNKYNEFNVCSEADAKTSKGKNKTESNHDSARESKSKRKRDTDKYDSDVSPPRNSRVKSSKTDKCDSDLNPPRNSKSRNNKKTDKYDSDLSPPRNPRPKIDNQSDKYDSDLSPPRNSRSKVDKRSDSPRNSRHDKYAHKNHFNHSPERSFNPHQDRYRKYTSKHERFSSKRDSSPQRNYSNQRPKVSRWDEEKPSKEKNKNETNKKMKKTLDGTSAGLQNLKSLKEEEEAQKKREAEMMRNMEKDVSGYGQTTVVRDRKTGRKRDLDKEAADKRERQKAQDEIDEKYSKWGKGLKQMEDRNDQLKSDLHEMSKPLARYADDEDLDRELRARDRDDDPMLAYMKEKEIKEGKRAPDKPKYEGSYMPNRFGIKPGYRWDGVDRSNGYEKKWFEARNTKKAIEDEAYKWSTADM